MQKDIPYILDGMVLHIPYINIGDTDKFNNWLKNNFQNILSDSMNKEKDFQPMSKNSEENKCYFSYQEKQLGDLEKLSFVIPEYQRRYVWDSNNRRELYRQIAGDKNLYLGTIVLRKEKNEDSYRIVDGQQRLTTIAMIKKVLGELEAKSGLVRLSGNRNLNNVENELKNSEVDLTGFKCHFDVIYVSGPSIYQYDVFSSINSAGKKLTIEEIIKNYLMKRYPDKDHSILREIAELSGFAKALCECKKHEFCSGENIYHTFKDVTEKMEYDVLNFYYNVFSFITCTADSISVDNLKLNTPVWLKLIKALGVTTSDSLMLNCFSRIISDDKNEKQERINDLSKRICFIYFLLYVMDRPGDGKKSANSSFPKCMQVSDDTQESFAAIILKSQADSQYWNTQDNISEQIWEQYIKTLPIYDTGYTQIKRFILLMIEYMMVNDTDTIKEWEENAANQDNLDIEHIFPASDKALPKGNNVRLSYSRLNYLENLMLLESDINKTVKDKMLHDKLNDPDENNNTQKKDQNKSKGYCDSKLFMAKMFRKGSRLGIPDRQNCIYDDKLADRRMELLKERIIKKLGEFLKDVTVPLKDVGSIPKEEKQESKAPSTPVSSARKNSSQKAALTDKSGSKTMENV